MALSGAIAGLVSLGFLMPMFFAIGGSWGDALPVALVNVALVAILAAVWGGRLSTPLPAGGSIVLRSLGAALVSWLAFWGALIALATIEAAVSTQPWQDAYLRAFGQAVYGLAYVVLLSPAVVLVAIQLALAPIASSWVHHAFGTGRGDARAVVGP